ncbi:MAG: hypothetical protein WEA09_10370 [Gemmatimonadota bacterium]
MAIYPIWLQWSEPALGLSGEVQPAESTPSAALELLALRELEEEEETVTSPESEIPTQVAPPVRPGPPTGQPAAGELERTPGRTGRTAAEQLLPQMVDPRLWQGVDPELTQLSDEERALLRLHALFRAANDSAALAEEAARRATDWSTTDEEGNRWGVSPGKIHLGKFSLPLPFHFTPPPGRRDQAAQRAWEWEQLQQGAASGQAWENFNTRAREIRERKDRERADTLGTGN